MRTIAGKMITKEEMNSIVDEVCTCGHLKSDHEPHFEPGYGRCTIVGCNCGKFGIRNSEGIRI